MHQSILILRIVYYAPLHRDYCEVDSAWQIIKPEVQDTELLQAGKVHWRNQLVTHCSCTLGPGRTLLGASPQLLDPIFVQARSFVCLAQLTTLPQ